MYQRISLIILTLVGVVSIGQNAFAQEFNPYSGIGIGEQETSEFPINRAMGGLGAAFSSPISLNLSNPASYSSLQRTTLEMGMYSNYRSLKTIDTSLTTYNSTLSHVAVGFPITPWWGGSFGIMPYSRTGYHFAETDSLPGVGNIHYDYTGSGGINKFILGNGFAYKGLAIGANIGYLFGNLNYTRVDSFPDGTDFLNSRSLQKVIVSDLVWDAGIQYTDSLKKDYWFVLGLKGYSNQNISPQVYNTWTRIDYLENGATLIKDTVVLDSSDVAAVLPASYSAGFTFGKGFKWKVGVDVTYTQWSNFQYFLATNNYKDNIRFGFGGEFSPDPEGQKKKYLASMNYRLGGYYNTGSLQFGTTTISDYGMNFGVGLPLTAAPKLKSYARLHLAGALGQRGTTENNLVKETYFKLWLGFTLNELWFVKRKFD